jgi:hypothetical protein
MDQFTRVFETPYENTDINAFNCNVDRIGDGLSPKGMMYVINHFVYGVIQLGSHKIEIPYKEQAQYTNDQSSLFEHINKCTNEFQKKPNFIEVDFYTIGDALEVVANLNNVSFSVKSTSTKKSNSLKSPVPSIPTAMHRTHLSPTEHVVIDNRPTENSSSFKQAEITIPIVFVVLSLIAIFL